MQDEKYVINPDFNPYEVVFTLKSKLDCRKEEFF